MPRERLGMDGPNRRQSRTHSLGLHRRVSAGQGRLPGGKTIRTHREDIDKFRAMFPDIAVQGEKRWVDAGTFVTSAGISAGLDMSLHLVARFEGEELAV